jgi:hypothetical protein
MFIETIIALTVLILAGALVLGLLKLVFGLVLLPLKLAFWLAQGLLGLVIGLPLLLVGGLLLGTVLPAVLLLFVLPVWIVGAVVCFFLG